MIEAVSTLAGKIVNCKRKGEATGFITILFSIAVIILITFYIFQLYLTNAQIGKYSNALVASNLSVYRNINLKVLADDPQNIIINDYNSALSTFKKYLESNFNLDSEDMPLQESFIKSRINIKNFIIYNVSGSDVIILTYLPLNNSFTIDLQPGMKGMVKTPKGTIITNTTVHSEISFDAYMLFQKRTISLAEDTDIINTK